MPARPLPPSVGALVGIGGAVVAVTAIAVGVGLGLPHLTKTGLSVGTVVGLTALVGGLVLLVVAGRRLLRPLRRWWSRGLAVLGLVVLTGVALLTLGVAVAATHVPPTDLGDRDPGDVGLAYETVEVTTPDGVTLSAWYTPSTNGAAVVLLHGAGSTRSTVLDHAAVLAGHGYGVLMLDARGHGDSDGRAMDFGWNGERDVAGAVTFLESRDDVERGRIGAVGLSMGGEEAIGAMGADERIAAVVAEGATGRVAADDAWLSEEYGAQGWLQEQLDRLRFGAVDLLTSAPEPRTLRESVTLAAPRPALLIAAGDVADEGHAAEHIRLGSPDTVEIWVVPDAGHTDGLDTNPEEWEERVVAFLDRALGAVAQSDADST